MGESFVVETDIIHDLELETWRKRKSSTRNALNNVKSWIQIWFQQQQKTLGCPNRHFKRKQKKNTIILLWRETPCRSCEAGAPNPNKSTIGSPWRCNTIPAEGTPPRVPRWRRRCRRSSAKLLRPFWWVFDMGKSHGNYQMGTNFLGGQVGRDLMEKNKVPCIQSHGNSLSQSWVNTMLQLLSLANPMIPFSLRLPNSSSENFYKFSPTKNLKHGNGKTSRKSSKRNITKKSLDEFDLLPLGRAVGQFPTLLYISWIILG